MSSKYPATNSFMERSRNIIHASRLSRLTPSKAEDHYTPDKKLMERDYSVTKSKSNLHDKVESILKHNSHLLSENNKLVQIIREKDHQLGDKESVIHSIQAQLHTARNGLKVFELQRNRAMVEFRQDRDTKESQISQILTHNDMLKSKLTSLETQHKIEIISLKDALMKEARSKIEYLKNAQFQQNEQSQKLISHLKSTITSNNMEFEHRLHSHSMVERELQEDIRVLQNQLRRVVNANQLELQQAKLNYKNLICESKRQTTQSHEKQISDLQMQIKRLKKDIVEKAFQNDRLVQQQQYIRDNNKQEQQDVSNDKLLVEIDRHQMQIKNKEAIAEQRHKLSLLADSQIRNLEECHKTHFLSLESQKNKLLSVNRLKQEENLALQSQLQQAKGVHQRQIGCLQGLVSLLESKLESMEEGSKQESQLLKVKVSQLHQNDVSALIGSHQIQIETLCDRITKLQCRNKQAREKLHKELQEKTQMRKHYQIQISKIGHKNTDLRLRAQVKELQAKENTEVMNSRNNIVSLQMLNETQVNKKDVSKRDGDITKLQDLVESKDREIQSLNEVLTALKTNFQQEVEQCRREIQALKGVNQSLQASQRREKQFYQKQIKRRQSQSKDEREALEEQLSNLRASTYQGLMQQLGRLQKQNARLESLLSKETQEKQNHLRAVNTYKEMTEILQLESSSALQTQEHNMGARQSLHHSKKVDSFNSQLQSKDKEIQQLKRRLIEKSDDLEQMQRSHWQVQERLKVLMEKAGSRTDLENRVINLGMDTNLLQNKAQLFS